MASKWINAILWTLVTVNLITLVLGGLITWLGYTIPIRLKQFGLSPEITQLAGFASLLVACLGLGGLNYSSHYALNAYGLSCAVFIMLMLFGALPNSLQRAIYNPSQSADESGLQPQQHRVLAAGTADNSSSSASSSSSSSVTNTGGNSAGNGTATPRLKPNQAHGGGLILDLLYIVLLLILTVLLALAVILAQHLRRRELEEEEGDEEDEEAMTMVDCCDQELVGSGGGGGGGQTTLQRNSTLMSPHANLALATRGGRMLSSMRFADIDTDWSCTCKKTANGDAGRANNMTAHATGQMLALATMGATNMVSPNNEARPLLAPELDAEQTRAALKGEVREEADKTQSMQKQVLTGGGGTRGNAQRPACGQAVDLMGASNQANAASSRLRSCKSATPNRWQTIDSAQQHFDWQQEKYDMDFRRHSRASRLGSKSLADLAHDDEVGQEAHFGTDNYLASCVSPTLISKGFFYAGEGHDGNEQAHFSHTDSDMIGSRLAAAVCGELCNRSSCARGTNNSHNAERRCARQCKHTTDNHQYGHRWRTLADTRCCCCSELSLRPGGEASNDVRTTLTFAPSNRKPSNIEPGQESLEDHYHRQHHHHNHRHNQSQRLGGRGGGDDSSCRPAHNHNSIASKPHLSSVYAIRSPGGVSDSFRARKQQQKQLKLSSSSVMAMTASAAAAAFLGGVTLNPATVSNEHNGFADSPLMDDAMDFAMDGSPLGTHLHLVSPCEPFNNSSQPEVCTNNPSSSTDYLSLA